MREIAFDVYDPNYDMFCFALRNDYTNFSIYVPKEEKNVKQVVERQLTGIGQMEDKLKEPSFTLVEMFVSECLHDIDEIVAFMTAEINNFVHKNRLRFLTGVM